MVKMLPDDKSTRQAEADPISKESERERHPHDPPAIAEERRHTMRTRGITGGKYDCDIEGPIMSGKMTTDPAFALDIILPHLDQFCFTGQVCEFLQGTRIFGELNFDPIRLHE
jgi:hypothetical protein